MLICEDHNTRSYDSKRKRRSLSSGRASGGKLELLSTLMRAESSSRQRRGTAGTGLGPCCGGWKAGLHPLLTFIISGAIFIRIQEISPDVKSLAGNKIKNNSRDNKKATLSENRVGAGKPGGWRGGGRLKSHGCRF